MTEKKVSRADPFSRTSAIKNAVRGGSVPEADPGKPNAPHRSTAKPVPRNVGLPSSLRPLAPRSLRPRVPKSLPPLTLTVSECSIVRRVGLSQGEFG
jgi:hypothetical protein